MRLRLARLLIAAVLTVSASAAPPRLKFLVEGDLQKIDIPKLTGVQITSADEPDIITVHARLEQGVDGKPAVAIWLDPGITLENRIIVSCLDNRDCKDRKDKDFDAAILRSLFFQALDLALFEDERGLGFMTISTCQAETDRAMLDLASKRNVGIDSYFHYVVANYDSTEKRIRSTTQYELKLQATGRQSDTKGWFEGSGKTKTETMQYLRGACTNKAGKKNKYKPLLIQLRPPQLRWDTQANNLRSN